MNPSDTHTILVVDDHPLFRKGVIQLIQATPNSALSVKPPVARKASSSHSACIPT